VSWWEIRFSFFLLWIFHYFLAHLKFVISVEGVLLTDFTGLIKFSIMVTIDLQNRHGKSSEAVTNDSENIPEDSSTKKYV